jgi:HEAT repeat protein
VADLAGIAKGAIQVGVVAVQTAALVLCLGCHRNRSTSAATATGSVDADLLELVDVMTPLEKTVTSDITDRRFLRGRELLGQLRNAGRDAGLKAMEMLRLPPPSGKIRPVDVERALLDVAAHAAAEDARPLLESLVTQYGPTLELRTEATMLFAETSPRRALEVLEPMVKKAHPTQTQPPAEFILRSFVTACDKTGRSPVPELADVATNLFMDETARIRAVKELGHRPEPLAIQALQAILVESTGDGYLRRMAAQGLRDSLPKENACELFQRTSEREADLNFLQFLRDMLEKNCSQGTPPR